MVVVSGSWMKNVYTHPPRTVNTDIISYETKMAKAILICRPNSHHFQERTLILDQPIKVGRSVARAKPTSTNAIFDCKVLSRHHALIWYENGKFYLQDTKSSNGTFVNNNKLTAESENHELSSGDIVQFGVDVVENNRKVTHGCIIATIKLYLPDGKEAKASPSITDSDRQGLIPLDDLYRLNQVIQEANRREQYLESKLTALQQIVSETSKSAEESWQAYVGEERLLSRVSVLENQLQQISKNWSEDKLREELMKLKEDNESYQIAAKKALDKIHSERLQAIALAMEQERARIAAEQEAILAKEQFTQAQLELEEIAQKLTEEQRKIEERKFKVQQRENELTAKLEMETEKVLELQLKLREVNALSIQDIQALQDIREKNNLIYEDFKCEDDILAENEVSDSNLNNSNGTNNHINLMVRHVLQKNQREKIPHDTCELTDSTNKAFQDNDNESIKKVSFKVQEDYYLENDNTESGNDYGQSDEVNYRNNTYSSDQVDSKTLKYQFQSAQNELKKKIELLESLSNANKHKIDELEKNLNEEKQNSLKKIIENESLKQELIALEQTWKETCNENQQYKDKINLLINDLEIAQNRLKEINNEIKNNVEYNILDTQAITNNVVSIDQLVNLEEELVVLKERFAQINEDKIKLQRDLLNMTDQYNTLCNRSYNKYFFYITPLVFMVLYLLISAMIS